MGKRKTDVEGTPTKSPKSAKESKRESSVTPKKSPGFKKESPSKASKKSETKAAEASPEPVAKRTRRGSAASDDGEPAKKKSKKDSGQEDLGFMPEARRRRKSSGGDDGNPDVSDFNISKSIQKQLEDRGITKLFPIQAATFDHIMAEHDLIGRARTGTGKTLAFALPIMETLLKDMSTKRPGRAPKVLVMTPTRELARQVCSEFETVSKGMEVLCVYGGTEYGPQRDALRKGLDVVVGTPGRLIDLYESGSLKLNNLRFIVLDEADEMLDIGFQEAMEKVLNAANEVKGENMLQTLLFSATIPVWVKDVAKKYLRKDQKMVDLVGDDKLKTNQKIEHLAMKCNWQHRAATLGDVLLVYGGAHTKTIIFADTKAEANKLALEANLKQDCQVLHGDIAQKQRDVTMQGFRDGRFTCLVATDVAARGLDISDVELVIQCQPPNDSDTYVHRSGRTGRAGKKGVSITFFTPREEPALRILEKKTGIQFKRIGAPQPGDIVKASCHDAVTSLEKVHPGVVPYFEEAAARVLEKRDPVKTLAAALAFISGHTEPPKSRSLLSSMEGYTTLMFTGKVELKGNGFLWGILRRHFSEELVQEVKGMKQVTDGKSIVFDVPSKLGEDILEHHFGDPSIKFAAPNELPEMVDHSRVSSTVKSMIDGKEGMATVKFESKREIRSANYVWLLLRKYYTEDFTEKVTNMTLAADGYKAMFDVPWQEANEVEGVRIRDPSINFMLARGNLPEASGKSPGRFGQSPRGGRGGYSPGGRGGFASPGGRSGQSPARSPGGRSGQSPGRSPGGRGFSQGFSSPGGRGGRGRGRGS